MGLIIARKLNEEFVLFATPGTDPAMLIEQITEGVTIRVHDLDDGRGNVKLDICAPSSIKILRSELIGR